MFLINSCARGQLWLTLVVSEKAQAIVIPEEEAVVDESIDIVNIFTQTKRKRCHPSEPHPGEALLFPWG